MFKAGPKIAQLSVAQFTRRSVISVSPCLYWPLVKIDNRHSAITLCLCSSAPLPAFNQKRRGLTKKPQNRKNFSNPLTIYFIITYLFSTPSPSFITDVFFNLNAHLRPIMWILYIPTLGAKSALGDLFWSLKFRPFGFLPAAGG